ncbi:hypothetical protein [Spongiactinospora sp. TRM90649]|nr:hypothetical protein [Spongiactinospora sp. TRM90649]MDF5757996.1 hypothetical protein [Spongiactinospora sp. TRM90649]
MARIVKRHRPEVLGPRPVRPGPGALLIAALALGISPDHIRAVLGR